METVLMCFSVIILWWFGFIESVQHDTTNYAVIKIHLVSLIEIRQILWIEILNTSCTQRIKYSLISSSAIALGLGLMCWID
ncbi:hypothetical protein L5515_017428 [Caenorhabditis briggsae]|uniref:Uncharacterized protein n=1 Tax=Caenorhabditis briggsae TaxID=6238 RepID=A0AAE9JSK4_CAEBR|nr:hypothetical protein L5515_017428 [Caenorhabditis briggsae]